MKKITFSILFFLLVALLFPINANAATSDMEYKTGHQIEMYLNSGTAYDVSELAPAGYLQIKIEDQSVATVENNKLVAKSEGFTYISFYYNTYVLHRNIVVHSGYDKVTSVKINNTTVTSGSKSGVTLKVGEEYDFLVNNDANVDLSDVKIILQSPYDGVPVSEFVRFTDNGKLQVVGAGSFYVTFKFYANKSDQGIKVLINSTIGNTAFETAANKYLIDNDYEPTCTEYSEKFLTASELSMIDELTLTSLSGLPNADTKKIFPNLKKIVFNLADSGTSVGTVNIVSGDFEYRFVGSTAKTYSMKLTFGTLDYVKITFENFKLSSSGATLDLKKVSNADMYFYGKCAITSTGTSSAAVVGTTINMVLYDKAEVKIYGGNGGDAAKGGIGIETKHLYISGKQFSQTATIEIYGGNGGSATSTAGASGGDGNVGVKATSLTVKGSVSCFITGGSGGNGKAGTDKNDTSVYPQPSPPGQASEGNKGTTGDTGADGGSGGSGGNGAYAIEVTTLQVIDAKNMVCTGGNGGNGAKGGIGGQGANGGKGGNTKKGTEGGKGGTGGTGGTGGRGGDGGDGSVAIKVVNVSDLKSCQGLSLVHGYGGNAGSGGQGGQAGNGGDGGDDVTPGAFLGIGDGPEEGDGGDKGTGGTGGKAGSTGDTVSKSKYFNVDGVSEITAINPSPTTASNGTKGADGSEGNDGDHGAM